MNRSLRNLALLGLLALGASTAGAQNLLFNLTYNPSQYSLVITPTSAAASGSLSGLTFLPEYGVLFNSLFSSTPAAILPNDYRLPTSSVTGGIASTAGSGTAMNNVYSDSVDPRDLNVASLASGTMTFGSATTAFTSSPSALTITFSSSVDPFMRTSSLNGGLVSAFSSVGTEYSIGTYNYSVVPEPSTYAAIAGALGLAYAVYRRRRQAAAAAATA